MASIFKIDTKKGVRWRASVQFNNHRETKSGFLKERDAKAWCDQKMVEFRGTMPQAYKEGVETFKDLLERYEAVVTPKKRGQREEVIRLRRFAKNETLGNLKINELTPAVFAKYRDERLKEVSPGSVRREMNTLNHLLKIAHNEWQVLPSIPTKNIAKPKDNPPRRYLITSDEVYLLRIAFDFDNTTIAEPRHRAFMAFMVSLLTGLRASEVLNIRREDIEGNVLHVRKGKTGGREVPLVAQARAYLYELDQEKMFDMKPSQLDALFRKYRDKVKLKCRFHDARGAFATYQASTNRLNPMQLARVLGHKDLETTMIYYREKVDDLVKLMEE